MAAADQRSPEERRAALRIGMTLGERWTIERVLGVGGMAAVYAVHAPDGTRAALKLLHPEHAIRKEIRERFLREGQAANGVGHPGAVRILDSAVLEDEETAYLVMELLDGESLNERRAREELTPDELLDVLDQTLDVLAAAHDRGIVHRDLKPDNLFITKDGKVKVLDFGLARFLDAVPGDVKTRTGIAMGTLPYMAPEQALGKRDEIDGRTDLFALGAMSFRLLTGRRVHEADSEAGLLLAMATKAVPPLASVLPTAPRWVAMIVDTALAFARDARYPDARTMQSDVRAVRAGSLPPYASRLSTARDEATRAERPAAPAPSALGVPMSPPPSGATSTPILRAPSAVVFAPASQERSALGVPMSPPGRFAPISVPQPRVTAPPGYAGAARAVPQSNATPTRHKSRRVFLALIAVAVLLLAVLLVGVGFTASRWLGARPASSAGVSDEIEREWEKKKAELEREAEKRKREQEDD